MAFVAGKDVDIAIPYFQSTGTLTPVGSLKEKLRRATRRMEQENVRWLSRDEMESLAQKLEQENDTLNEEHRKLQQYIKQVIHQAKLKEPPQNSFAKLLNSISNILPGSTRTKVYEPAFNDLLETFLLEKQQCKTARELKWLTFWFYLRKVLLVQGSFKAMIVDNIQKLFPWISRK